MGARIARLLDARAENLTKSALSGTSGVEGAIENGQTQKKRKRKHKVVIHSSPFLRCLQTSIAISSGLAQYEENSAEGKKRRRSSVIEGFKPSRVKNSIAEEEEGLAASTVVERRGSSGHQDAVRQTMLQSAIDKTTLRVDAFLGEWMSPDYYSDIMVPPESTLMIAGAKAELLRAEPLDIFIPSATGRGNFPGGWNRVGGFADDLGARPPSPGNPDNFAGMSALAQVLPRRDRASSYSSAGNVTSPKSQISSKTVLPPIATTNRLYTAPIPAYAISMSNPIPKGYVAHAREACINVDLQWDSMREPQNWGDGGEYGEEWSAMHKRFRLGLYRLISWYKDHAATYCPHTDAAVSGSVAGEDDSDDYDLVLVLVTHGAGCNALIGAITNQPVLIDVGMASLTMAVRKSEVSAGVGPTDGNEAALTSPQTRRSSVDFGLSQEYEIQVLASSEHLRNASESTPPSALQSPKIVPQIPEFHGDYKPSSLSMDESIKPRNNNRDAGRPINSALGSMRRSSILSPSSRRNDSNSPSRTSGSGSATGLWSRTPTTPGTLDGASDLSTSPPKDFSLSPALREKEEAVAEGDSESEKDDVAPLQPHARSMSGLWDANSAGTHQLSPKRRWTVNERDQ